MYSELKACFNQLQHDADCRSIILSGKGKGFTSGLDLKEVTNIISHDSEDAGRKAFSIRKLVEAYQDSISSVEEVLFQNKTNAVNSR